MVKEPRLTSAAAAAPGSFRPGRRDCLWVAGAAAVLLGTGLPRLRAQPEVARLRVVMGREESLCHLPLTVAQQLGYFRAEGLDVRLLEVAEPASAAAAVQAGEAELGSGAYLGLVQRQLQGQTLQTVVLEGRTPKVSLGVCTRLMGSWRGMADLRGKRIGVATSGSLSQTLAQVCLARAGLKQADVQWVSFGSMAEGVQALRWGGIDALSHLDPGMTQLEQKGEVRVVADPRTPKGAHEVFGGPMPGTCVYAQPAFVSRHPQTCQAFVYAVARSLRWLQTAQPQDIIKTVPEAQVMGDRALYLASFYKVRESYSPDGELGEEALQIAWKVAGAAVGETRHQDLQALLERSHTNEFVLRARARLKA
ncbi:ABC transporter substrate-binding protein [Aquabacterium sp. A7-Y]|uniref:ABC transporter substrate-binding protein n=1 Tax=Aquabacterium sp. A7-Y TaxID=1349605 RepID=UPI00223E42FB|nr:ABC transporter substrate-binding protein [Aquabacterium sp. A7-Y]MCW7540386.1 ABC transporter substrate-binding protein [Aquabacterium sp. A7-Y]